ncbi:type II toxin-antitoxin system RelE/ParE family toxin [Lonepinella koalarum]|uniref:ParE-like toxin of type II ParDE toxin-antitoxin system n=1 Tax=Lonepinella koalarum TaxID=53417 RepID=A0A4R1KZK7_9PAST|nr:type II toxin-antitoxin system RelE/ParE family toxin [Lonepinella koalarum]TCK70050.1 hypothetical protein EV692_1273 [Lonepinella koalarum]
MKTDYKIIWRKVAEEKLEKQAQYLLEQSKNLVVASNFYQTIKDGVNRLSYYADAYKFQEMKKIYLYNG